MLINIILINFYVSGLEKADTESGVAETQLQPVPTHNHASLSGLGWKSNTPPDLGFVDYVDSPSPSSSLSVSPVFSTRMPFSGETLETTPDSCHPRLAIPSDNSVKSSSNPNANTANLLLSKSLKVDVAKLPTVMTSMVTSKNHPSLMFKRSEVDVCNPKSRKRYAASLSNNQRTSNKKCPRFVSTDQRKTTLNKTIPGPGTKELLLHPNLFNSFRITKPKSNIKCDSASVTKCNEAKFNGVNGIHFETQSFYKFSDSGPNLAVNKQSDLIPPTSAVVPSSTVFSNKTEANDRVSSTINLLEPKNDKSENGNRSQSETRDPDPDESSRSTDNAIFALPNPKKIRFPAVPNSSAIQCKWEGCGECFKTHGALSDHIKVIQKKLFIYLTGF